MPIISMIREDYNESLSWEQETRRELEKLAREKGILITTKEESLLMRIIDKILFFNRQFMESFITTIGSTIYFPKNIMEDDFSFCMVTPHEMVHAEDMKTRLFTGILYLMPQLLSVFSLLSLFSFINLFNLLWLLFLVFLLPMPSPWRKNFEMRGFAMTMACMEWRKEKEGEGHLERPPEYIKKYFTGPLYYYMWPFEEDVERELEKWLKEIHEKDISRKIKIAADIEKIFR